MFNMRYSMYINYKLELRKQNYRLIISHICTIAKIRKRIRQLYYYRYNLLLNLTNLFFSISSNNNVLIERNPFIILYFLTPQKHFRLIKFFCFFDKFKFIFKTRNFYLHHFKNFNIGVYAPKILSELRSFRSRYTQQLKLIKFVLYYHFEELGENIILFFKNYSAKDFMFFSYFVKILKVNQLVYKGGLSKNILSLQILNNVFYGKLKLKKYPRKKRFLIKKASLNKQYIKN